MGQAKRKPKPKTPPTPAPKGGRPPKASAKAPPRSKKKPKESRKPTGVPIVPANPQTGQEAAGEDLNVRQAAFVRAYIITGNATQSAIKAGYSIKCAAQVGEEVLRNPEIQQVIRAAQAADQARYQVTKDRLLEELAGIAFGDIRDVMKEDASGLVMKRWEDMEPRVSRTIASISQSDTEFGGSTTIKRYDKVQAITMLGKRLGLWKEDGDGDGPGSQSDREARNEIRERVRKIMAGG